jgi:long-chain acyl-CoA synthetase
VNFGESIDTVAENLREISPSFFLGVPRIWEKMQNSILVKKKDATRLQQWVIDKSISTGLEIAARRKEKYGRFAGLGDRLWFLLFWLVCFRPLQKHLGLNKARTMLCGGATVSPEVLEFFWALGLKVYQVYGMTELSGISHTQYWGCTGKGLSGQPMDGYEHRIAEDGEILVRTPAVFNGYLHNEEATKATFEGEWLKTGDIGEIRPDKSIAVTDRKKDIIITSGGKNITPSLIENRAKDSIYIRECVLIGERRNYLSALIQIDFETVGKWAQERGIAYTNFKSLSERPDVRDLIAGEIDLLNREFSRVENIRKFKLLTKELDHDDGEVTATMKVRRSVIEEKFKSLVDEMYGG